MRAGFKRIVLIGSLLASLILSTPTAFSATISGTKCSKVGATKTVSSVKYMCIKSGKKMIWNKGVVIKKDPTSIPSPSPAPTKVLEPTPTVSPTPTKVAEPKVTPSPSPTAMFSPPTAPTDWNDLIKNADGISYWAWKKSSEKISKSATKLGVIEIIMSPNATPDNPTPLIGMNFVSRLVANFNEPNRVKLVYVDEKDVEWGQKLIDEFCAQNACGYDVKGEAKKACNVPVTPCWGGLAVRNQQTDVPMIYVTASDWGKKDANHVQGTLEAHEYFHNIQDKLLAQRGTGVVPRWLIEGGATWAARAAVFNEDFAKYSAERENNNSETLNRIKPKADRIETFLSPNYTTGWEIWNDDRYHQWNVYDVGSLASEILVALKGPDAFMNLFKNVGEGKLFSQAFGDIYGISWTQGAKIIAEAIVAQQR